MPQAFLLANADDPILVLARKSDPPCFVFVVIGLVVAGVVVHLVKSAQAAAGGKHAKPQGRLFRSPRTPAGASPAAADWGPAPRIPPQRPAPTPATPPRPSPAAGPTPRVAAPPRSAESPGRSPREETLGLVLDDDLAPFRTRGRKGPVEPPEEEPAEDGSTARPAAPRESPTPGSPAQDTSRAALVAPLDTSYVARDVFASGESSLAVRRRFEDRYPGRRTAGTGRLLAVEPFSYDFVLGSEPGHLARVDIAGQGLEGGGPVHALFRLPDGEVPSMRSLVGTEISFEGKLLRIESLERNLYLSDARARAGS